MDRLVKIVNSFQRTSIFAKKPILDVWLGSDYAFNIVSFAKCSIDSIDLIYVYNSI